MHARHRLESPVGAHFKYVVKYIFLDTLNRNKMHKCDSCSSVLKQVRCIANEEVLERILVEKKNSGGILRSSLSLICKHYGSRKQIRKILRICNNDFDLHLYYLGEIPVVLNKENDVPSSRQ